MVLGTTQLQEEAGLGQDNPDAPGVEADWVAPQALNP